MTIMETKNVNIPFVTIEEESGSDLSNDDLKEINVESGLEEAKLLLPTELSDDGVDGDVTEPQSQNTGEDHDEEEKAPLLRQNNLGKPSIKKGRFTVSKSPDTSKADFYSANIESIFQNMEPLSRKPKPNLKIDIEKANGPHKEKVSFDFGSGKSPAHEDTTMSVVNEVGNPLRRPSKMFMVINYGNVSTEHIPASSPAPSTRLDTEKNSWPKQHRDSGLLLGSHPHLKDLFHSQGKLHLVQEDRRRSSLRPNFKYGPPAAPKPRVRLVSGTHSVNVNDSDVDDILSLSSYHTTGSHYQIYQKPNHLSISDITSKPDILPDISEDKDITDNKYAVETVRGSLGHMSKTLLDVAKRGRLFAKRKTGRLIMKDGTPNIDLKNIKTRNKKFMVDIFTTVLDIQWRYVLFLFCLAFVFSWLAFAGGWLLIAYIHGDSDGTSEMNCVDNVDSFYTASLFSIETQHTIGYGTRAITAYCPPTFFLFMLQSIFGVIVQCVMAGIIFAKLAKPKHRAATIMFSKNAVICKRDGEYCLNFRVADMRSSQLVGAILHAMFVKKKVTKEGEVIPFHQHHMEIKTECEDHDQFIFLAWPIRIVHHIDLNSPLWNTSAEQLLTEDFEIIVILEGCIESSGMTTQIRTSYLPCEVLWGQTLSNMQTSRNGFGKQEIDYRNFHETQPAELPECSAKEYYEH